jgi:hypothetical protein
VLVTNPVVPIVATEVVLLDHTPPDVVLLNKVVAFSQILRMPVIAATTGTGLTVTTVVTLVTQPKLLVTV